MKESDFNSLKIQLVGSGAVKYPQNVSLFNYTELNTNPPSEDKEILRHIVNLPYTPDSDVSEGPVSRYTPNVIVQVKEAQNVHLITSLMVLNGAILHKTTPANKKNLKLFENKTLQVYHKHRFGSFQPTKSDKNFLLFQYRDPLASGIDL